MEVALIKYLAASVVDRVSDAGMLQFAVVRMPVVLTASVPFSTAFGGIC